MKLKLWQIPCRVAASTPSGLCTAGVCNSSEYEAMLYTLVQVLISNVLCHYHAGFNGYGQLGDNTTTNRPSPIQVVGNSTWTALPSHGWGYGYTCAIMANASLWCWVSSCGMIAELKAWPSRRH